MRHQFSNSSLSMSDSFKPYSNPAGTGYYHDKRDYFAEKRYSEKFGSDKLR